RPSLKILRQPRRWAGDGSGSRLAGVEDPSVALWADPARAGEVVAQHAGVAETDLAGDPLHRVVGLLEQLLGRHHALRGDPGVRGGAGLVAEPACERAC